MGYEKEIQESEKLRKEFQKAVKSNDTERMLEIRVEFIKLMQHGMDLLVSEVNGLALEFKIHQIEESVKESRMERQKRE